MVFQPKVSIVIPVHNGANFLSKAIDSALAQTYSNIEILVINDGSNDNGATREIALNYGDSISYFEKENGGVSTALNLGIEKMSGEYFSWLSHDDEYYPEKIQKQIVVLSNSENKEIILFSDFVWIDNRDKIVNESILPSIKNMSGLKAVCYGHIGGCTLLIPKICFNEVGGFSENLPVTQDYDMWFRLSGKFTFKHMPISLVKTRLHDEQTTLTYTSRDVECNNLYIDFLNKMTKDDIQSMEKLEIIFYIKLLIVMESKNYSDVAQYILENKLQNYSKIILKLLYFFYAKIYTSWFNKMSLLCLFFNPLWSTKRVINFLRYKVIQNV